MVKVGGQPRPPVIDATDKPWWTYGEIAARLVCSEDKVEDLVRDGLVKPTRLWPGRKGWRVAGTELARYERSRVEATAAERQEPMPAVQPRRGRRKSLREMLAAAE